MVLNCGIIRWRTLQPANYRARCNMRRWCIRRYILRSPYVPIFDYLQTKLWSRRRAPRCTLVIHMIVYILDYYGKGRERSARTQGAHNRWQPRRGRLEFSAPVVASHYSDLHNVSNLSFFFLFPSVTVEFPRFLSRRSRGGGSLDLACARAIFESTTSSRILADFRLIRDCLAKSSVI